MNTPRVAFTLEQCWHEVPGGTAVATLRLLDALLARDDVEMVPVAGRHRRPPAAVPPMPVHALPLARPWLYEAWTRIGWPNIESATGAVDVAHATAQIPAPARAPRVVTLHDVAFLDRPERLTRHGARLLTRAVRRAVDCDAVVCPSHVVADQVVRAGVSADRVRVIGWGVDQVAVTDAERERVRTRFDLPPEMILAVATLEPRKNLARLVAAVHSRDDLPPLVVAGAAGWGGVAEELGAIDSERVRLLGAVGRADLTVLYDLAQVVAYPSEDEGFGLPVLEAMAAGTPVVTSQGTATEEVAGGAAVLVDPYNVESIADGLVAALADRAALSTAGRTRAAAMSWAACADAHVEMYQQLGSRQGQR